MQTVSEKTKGNSKRVATIPTLPLCPYYIHTTHIHILIKGRRK